MGDPAQDRAEHGADDRAVQGQQHPEDERVDEVEQAEDPAEQRAQDRAADGLVAGGLDPVSRPMTRS